MCGIAGYLTSEPVDPRVLETMVAALFHRGPDSAGFYEDGPFRAGMRRLSINDLSTGDQPLYNEARTVVLLYNGEIYNSPRLRRDLESRGHVFSTTSDGEVICHLYEEQGEDLFQLLDGMYAAALWIVPERRLILARDIPGEKPLYYTEPRPGQVVFASELKSLVRFPGLDLGYDFQALWDMPTFLWIPEPATPYKKVKALPRGHLLVVQDGKSELAPIPNRFNRQEIDLSEAAVVEETRRVVEEAVKSRLLSDVPVGSYLSSGLDSSLIAAVASRELDRLTTFTIGFENLSDPYHGRADESGPAAAFARELGTDHHTIPVTAQDFRRDLEEFCKYGDQPFSVSSGLGILAVSRAAREAGIKVLLSGDGADECFGGYSWYPYLDLPHEDGPEAAPDRPLSFQNFGQDLQVRLKALASYEPAKRAWAWHYYAAETEKAALFGPDLAGTMQSSLRHFAAFKNNGQWTPEEFIKQDREFYFPFEMLRKVDRMTMANSVEGRPPFAAPAVLAHADKLRFSHMIKGETLKWVLRRAFADILPAEITDRPKHGFNVPIDHWLKNEWADLMEETFTSGSELDRLGILGPNASATAQALLNDPLRLNGHTLFSFIMINKWLALEKTWR